jgi:hypothetical protein
MLESMRKDTVMEEKHARPEISPEEEARRQFLARCGRFAAVTPPAMALLASVAAAPNEARASTIPGRGGDDDNQGDNDNQ